MADPGAKCNTSWWSVSHGRWAAAAFVNSSLESTTGHNFDGTPSLNGFGDLVVASHVFESA